MNILVTGARGFVGKNLVAALNNIKYGKDRTCDKLEIDEVFEYDIDTEEQLLEKYCEKADFVFNLAGVNRPKDDSEFMKGNLGFLDTLLNTLKKCNNKCPVMLSSSIQAQLTGRYKDSEYGKSKLAGERLLFDYSRETQAKVLVYRFPNLFGKWCRPNYNSVIATFCNNIANGLPIQINDIMAELELVYIDDLVREMINALLGKESRLDDSNYCIVPVSYKVTLGDIVTLLNKFKKQEETLIMPRMAENSFDKKLFSTYLSYLPKEKMCVDLKMNIDNRGSFTELIKTVEYGQVSVNISKPGITKGEHWHNSKWELFIVVSGEGLIRQRKIGTDEVIEFRVSKDKLQAVYMLPGYTHNIINLSDTEDLVTVMWANEMFDVNHPDTFFEKVTD